MKSQAVAATIATLSLAVFISPLRGAPHNPNTDWFKDAKYGVFVHWLWRLQNDSKLENAMGKPPYPWTSGLTGLIPRSSLTR